MGRSVPPLIWFIPLLSTSSRDIALQLPRYRPPSPDSLTLSSTSPPTPNSAAIPTLLPNPILLLTYDTVLPLFIHLPPMIPVPFYIISATPYTTSPSPYTTSPTTYTTSPTTYTISPTSYTLSLPPIPLPLPSMSFPNPLSLPNPVCHFPVYTTTLLRQSRSSTSSSPPPPQFSSTIPFPSSDHGFRIVGSNREWTIAGLDLPDYQSQPRRLRAECHNSARCGCGGVVVRLLASHLGEPGSIPGGGGGVAPGFSYVVIVLDEALVGGFFRGPPPPPPLSALSFRRCTSCSLHREQPLHDTTDRRDEPGLGSHRKRPRRNKVSQRFLTNFRCCGPFACLLLGRGFRPLSGPRLDRLSSAAAILALFPGDTRLVFRVWEMWRTLPTADTRIKKQIGAAEVKWSENSSHHGQPGGAVVAEWLACSPPTKANRVQSRIVPYDAVGRRVFSVISRFPRPFIPELLHYHLTSIAIVGYQYLAVKEPSKSLHSRPTGRAWRPSCRAIIQEKSYQDRHEPPNPNEAVRRLFGKWHLVDTQATVEHYTGDVCDDGALGETEWSDNFVMQKRARHSPSDCLWYTDTLTPHQRALKPKYALVPEDTLSFFQICEHVRFPGHCDCYTTATLLKPTTKNLPVNSCITTVEAWKGIFTFTCTPPPSTISRLNPGDLSEISRFVLASIVAWRPARVDSSDKRRRHRFADVSIAITWEVHHHTRSELDYAAHATELRPCNGERV
ncbi:hypothetical protein PR048_001517 [Dryococelus australis]|uniref:Uncharacterized protein n=1 Tax=Dryococelus australis TaxID=614101 RepID=A0ABQ9IHQ8_9NEOP|nr:hypothetical protein PR048_001517 [Dryococelus australis]